MGGREGLLGRAPSSKNLFSHFPESHEGGWEGGEEWHSQGWKRLQAWVSAATLASRAACLEADGGGGLKNRRSSQPFHSTHRPDCQPGTKQLFCDTVSTGLGVLTPLTGESLAPTPPPQPCFLPCRLLCLSLHLVPTAGRKLLALTTSALGLCP